MSCLLKSANIATFDPPNVIKADLRIAGARVVERGPELALREGEQIIDLTGKLVMPGMVCAHTHLYSALARGMPAPPRPPKNFKEILGMIWWRLDRALDEESIYWSAMAGAMDAARAGTTCVFDHHASPSHIDGSLQIVREAIEKVGLRAVLCYEVTDRSGSQKRDRGLEENRRFLKWANESNPELFRAMVGAHASFTLSDDSLARCAALMREFDAGLHIHAAEDLCDVRDAREQYGLGVVERLAKHRALNRKTILAHGVHLSGEDIQIAREAGVWFAHNPRSNMNNRVGYAPVGQFGERIVLGTDGIDGDMFEEARFAFFRGRDRAQASCLRAEDWLRVLANNQHLASESFGLDLGSLGPGSAADLVILDYNSPTPITPKNLPWHLAFGLSSASVESVMVNGRFVVKDRRPALEEDVYAGARQASEKLWAKLEEI
jgi:putative selenium metabolism protein SsnA